MPAQLPAAVVLCGGLGTRLRDVVADRPKSLAPVAGRPFLAYLLDHLARQQVAEVILSAGHQAEQIVDFARTGIPSGLSATVSVEPMPLGTAGGIRFAAHDAQLTGTFLVLNGDTYFDGALRRLVEVHASRGATVTMALAHVDEAGRYGAVRFDEETLAGESFEEKSGRGPGWINAGVYVLSDSALADLPVGVPASLERDVLPTLVGRGLFAVPFADATFLDIGTPSDYEAAASILSLRSPS